MVEEVRTVFSIEMKTIAMVLKLFMMHVKILMKQKYY